MHGSIALLLVVVGVLLFYTLSVLVYNSLKSPLLVIGEVCLFCILAVLCQKPNIKAFPLAYGMHVCIPVTLYLVLYLSLLKG